MNNNEVVILASILADKVDWPTVYEISLRLDCPRLATETQRQKCQPKTTLMEPWKPERTASHRFAT